MVAFRSSSKKPSIQNFSPSTHAAALTPSSTHAAKLIQQHFHCCIHISVFTTNSTHASALILHSSECASVLITPQFHFTSSWWGKNQLCRDKKNIGFRWRAGKAWIGPAVGWAGLGGKKVLYILCFFCCVFSANWHSSYNPCSNQPLWAVVKPRRMASCRFLVLMALSQQVLVGLDRCDC